MVTHFFRDWRCGPGVCCQWIVTSMMVMKSFIVVFSETSSIWLSQKTDIIQTIPRAFCSSTSHWVHYFISGILPLLLKFLSWSCPTCDPPTMIRVSTDVHGVVVAEECDGGNNCWKLLLLVVHCVVVDARREDIIRTMSSVHILTKQGGFYKRSTCYRISCSF